MQKTHTIHTKKNCCIYICKVNSKQKLPCAAEQIKNSNNLISKCKLEDIGKWKYNILYTLNSPVTMAITTHKWWNCF